jgi:hypothetical protein
MARLAHFCPELIHQERRDDRRYRAEVKVYDALSEQLPQGWHVFYDVGWLNRFRPEKPLRDGQADFVVAHAHHGVLVLEVKGGAVRFDAPRQQWISTDTRGEDHALKNPFRQAKDSKYTLIEKLRELPALERAYVAAHHAVAFPDCDRPTEKVNEEAYPEIMIGRQDLHQLAPRLEKILKHSRGEGPFQNGRAIIEGLEYLLCRSVTLPNPLQSRLDEEHREIQKLTNAQINTLALLQRVRRVALGGGAGTGKTYIGVYKARNLAKQGFRTLLTCYSEPLAAFLKSLAGGVDNLRVASLHELARELVPSLSPDDSAPDTSYPEAVFDAMTRAARRPFDAIIVDEGQDFGAAWWPALESCLDEGKGGIFYVFHDTNNQVVRRGAGVLPPDLVDIRLEENVRNTQNICQRLTPHYRGDVPLRPHGPPGAAVELQPYADEAGLRDRLGKVLQRLLLVNNLLARDIVVLTPRDPGKDSALTRLGLPKGIQLVTEEAQVKGRKVLCASIVRFKGLERPVAVVAELDDRLPAHPGERDALLYVAFSRPRNLLVVLHTPQAADWVRPG